jgi:elongation factor P
MATLNYNEILPKKFIVIDNEPYEVMSAHVFRKQQRKPVNQTKLRGLKGGRVIERTFHQAENVEEADLDRKTIRYLYTRNDEYWFCDVDNPGNRFSLSTEVVGTGGKFLKENSPVEALIFGDQVIAVRLPIKMDLAVVEAPPAVRGNTAQGATKQIVLESGATVSVPLFINEGDVVRINTETGEYVERAEKK